MDYFRLRSNKISAKPLAAQSQAKYEGYPIILGFHGWTQTIFVFKSFLEAKVFEQWCQDNCECSLNTVRVVNMKDIDTRGIIIHRYDRVTGKSTKYPSISEAARNSEGMGRITVIRGFVKEVQHRYSFSLSHIKVPAEPTTQSKRVFVYKEGKLVGNKLGYPSINRAHEGLKGISLERIQVQLDKPKSYQGYSFSSERLKLKEIKLRLLNPVNPVKAARTEVWVYLNGDELDNSPFSSILKASTTLKSSGLIATRGTIANNLDTGQPLANGLEFYYGPKRGFKK